MSKVLLTDYSITFWCIACDMLHGIPRDYWGWNNNRDAPTITPSIRVEYDDVICHSNIQDGKQQYCEDSTHQFAGHVVNLPDISSEVPF